MNVKKNTLLAYGLIVTFGFLVRAQELQTSESIKSYGVVGDSMSALVIKRYTADTFFESTDSTVVASIFDMAQILHWDDANILRQIHEIKQNKQDFKALFYRNIRAIYNTSTDWQTFWNNSWILKDENGQLVYDPAWGSYLIDIGNPQYVTWVANKINEIINEYSFDGVFADQSLDLRASQYFLSASSSNVINPRTGQPWTDEEIRQALIRIHTEIKRVIGSKILLCNGIYRGRRFWRYYNESMEFLSNSPLDGIKSEGIWYQYDGAWMTEEEWLESLNFLVFLQENFLKDRPERFFVPQFKLKAMDGRIYPLPIGATEGQMLRYAFASTLLGIKNNQNYLSLYADMNLIIESVQPLFDIDLGVPINDYYVITNTHVYSRDFSQVKVLVNPTSDPYIIDLQGRFKTIDDELVSEIAVEGHTGILLIRVN